MKGSIWSGERKEEAACSKDVGRSGRPDLAVRRSDAAGTKTSDPLLEHELSRFRGHPSQVGGADPRDVGF